MPVRILLGPQTPSPNVGAALEAAGIDGPLAVITAGWRDSEGEIDELGEVVERPVEDLMLYHRAEEVFAREPALHALHRERQDRLAELQRLYRMRLAPALQAAADLLETDGEPDLVRLEQRAAISQLRALDRHHVRRIRGIHQHFDRCRADLSIPFAAAQRDALHQRLEQAAGVLITGGHVAVLLNRIRLFRLETLLATRPVIAWSAGAMVLCGRIALFHDNAPQGARDPEVLDAGLGLVRRLVPLPHAASRLKGSPPERLALFSRRFAPATCVTLDPGAMLTVTGDRVSDARNSAVLQRNGRRRVWRPR